MGNDPSGQKQTSNGDNSQSTTTTTTTGATNDSKQEEQEEEEEYENNGPDVKLHVYKQAGATGIVGSLVYHSGVEVNGKEYCYAQTSGDRTGISSSSSPKRSPGNNWIYNQTHEIGKMKSNIQLRTIISDLIKSDEWKGNKYNITHNNCNDFSEKFIILLCGESYKNKFPSYVNQAAKAGRMFVPKSMTQQNDEQVKKQQHEQMLRSNAEYAADYYKNIAPQPIKEIVKEIENDILFNEQIDWSQTTMSNAQSNSTDDVRRLLTQSLNSPNLRLTECEVDESEDEDDSDEDESDDDRTHDDDDDENKIKLSIKLKAKNMSDTLKLNRIAVAFPTNKNSCPTKIILQQITRKKKKRNIIKINYDKQCSSNNTSQNGIFWTYSYDTGKVPMMLNKSALDVTIEGHPGKDFGLYLLEFYGHTS